jgi:hypothetical protein
MSAIHSLEYLKYYTLKANKYSIGYRSKGNFTDLAGREISIETPEGKAFTVRSIRIDFGFFTFKDDRDNLDYWYKFDLRNFIDNPGNEGNNFMIPNFSVDSSFNDVDYKSYIFISEYYKKINSERPNVVASWENEYLVNSPKRDRYPHSMVIVVKREHADNFEDFMNLSYTDWKTTFDLAIAQKDNVKLDKYHPSIFQYELSFDQIILLLESFENIDLEAKAILSILNPKDSTTAVKLLNYLRNSTTNLNLRLYHYFTQGAFNLDNFVEYNEVLMSLAYSAIDRSEIETIAVNEANTYVEHPNADWNIFNKLAENAGVFVISTKPLYTSHFGIFNYFPKGATININPFNTDFLPGLPDIPEVKVDKTKIHFGYSALIKAKPLGSISETIVRFPEYDPFKMVKLYIVEEPEELKYLDNYKGFVELLFKDPKQSKIRYTYMPAICAYNYYVLNFTNHHNLVAAALLRGTLIGLSTALTFGGATPLTVPWFLGTAANFSMLGSYVIDAPAIKTEILKEDGGQEFIDAWHTLEQVTIALDISYIGFYGIKNLTYFIANKEAITLAKEAFNIRYLKFNLRIREALSPFYKSVYKNLETALLEAAEYEALLTPHLLPGKTWAWVVEQKIANNRYPELSAYLKPESIAEFEALLQSEGVSFFISEREIMKYESLPLQKFAGIESHMDIVESNFISNGRKIEQLSGDLAVGPNKFTTQDKIYYVKVKDIDGISLKVPDGNSLGSLDNLDWRPFGFLKPFKDLSTGETVFAREAVFFKTDETHFIYNKNLNEFVSIFGEANVQQIYP